MAHSRSQFRASSSRTAILGKTTHAKIVKIVASTRCRGPTDVLLTPDHNRRSTLKSKMLATAFASAVQGLVLPSAAGVHNVRSASITRSRVDLFFLSDEGKRNPAAVLEDEGVCHLLTDSQRVRARAASRFPAPHRCGLRSTFSECCRTAPQLLCHSCSATHTRPANAWTSMDPRRMPSTR